jgi:lysophospholipase L1-like esterase
MTEGDVAPLEPGTYVTGDPFLARVTFTVPAGWEGNIGGPYAVWLGTSSAPDALSFQIFDEVYADPCHDQQTLLDPLPGPSAGELADALAGLPGLDATSPTDVTLGGYRGKQLTITAPAPGGSCRVWELPLGATNDMAPGDRQRVWILDVDGQRLVIVAPEPPGMTAETRSEVQSVLDSIHIEPAAAPAESSTPSAPPHLSLVGLGDSIPGALNCPPGCRSYVEVYGDLASAALGVPVSVLNLATNDRLESAGLLSRVLEDHTYRTALAGADLITLTIGNNDQSGFWGCTSDDACAAARAETRHNIDAILHEIASLRAGKPTAVRVTDYYDMALGDQLRIRQKFAAFNAMICEVAEADGAVCVDLVRPFNGPEGLSDAGDLLLGDHIHASKAGQDLIAKTIAAAGYAPLHVVGLPAGPAPSGPVQGPGSPSPAASSPAAPGVLVTGTVTKTSTRVGDNEWLEDTDVENGRRQRGRDYTGNTQMSDPRLSGDVTATDNADRLCVGDCSPETFRADILWGTIEIANDGGTWVGTSVGTSDKSAEGRGVTYYELSGTGAYEGLSAVLFETETSVGEIALSGVIFPGELPPDR